MTARDLSKPPKLPALRTLRAMSDRAFMGELDRQAEFLDPGHVRRVTDEKGILGPADQRPYVTRSAHDGIPAGTACMVSRPDTGEMLRLEFADGRVVWTSGYAAGIEWALEQRTAEYAERVAMQDATEGPCR